MGTQMQLVTEEGRSTVISFSSSRSVCSQSEATCAFNDTLCKALQCSAAHHTGLQFYAKGFAHGAVLV